MATNDLKERLVDYVQDAHAMEKNSQMMLQSMVANTDDAEMKSLMEHHLKETESHIARLEGRLEAMGAKSSVVRDVSALLGSTLKTVLDAVRTEKPGKNARDGFITEQVEIAAYELLSRLAERSGDEATAEVARQNLADEKAMAEKISSKWDRVIDLTLAEEGIKA